MYSNIFRLNSYSYVNAFFCCFETAPGPGYMENALDFLLLAHNAFHKNAENGEKMQAREDTLKSHMCEFHSPTVQY